MNAVTKTITEFVCDVCKFGFSSSDRALLCEHKHKADIRYVKLPDLNPASIETVGYNVYKFSSFEEMNAFCSDRNSGFKKPGRYVYRFETGTFIALEDFLAQKKEELKTFNKIVKEEFKKLSTL
jgi:hypothetical protein